MLLMTLGKTICLHASKVCITLCNCLQAWADRY